MKVEFYSTETIRTQQDAENAAGGLSQHPVEEVKR
jgi:hypothetical protein